MAYLEAASGGTIHVCCTGFVPGTHGMRCDGYVSFSQKCKVRKKARSGLENMNLSGLQLKSVTSRKTPLDVGISHACRGCRVRTIESENIYASLEENWLLKRKAQEMVPYLDGRCIFLVGMMGSGKSTVGKVLADALCYSFVDSDSYVEQAFGGTSVAQIFKQCGETYFRDYETQALQKLSTIPRQVVSTGGGTVVRPINWKYMRDGITVFLDVPLDALARRIAAVGTDSRPMLYFDSGDPYTKAFVGLFTLSKKRAEAYDNADVRVSLLNIAAKAGLEDLSDITPAAIALEALHQMENLWKISD